MIKIDKDVPMTRQSKYGEYIKAMINMGKDESFVVNDYKIVDAVRGYAWKKGYKVSFREVEKSYLKDRRLGEVKYRIWKL